MKSLRVAAFSLTKEEYRIEVEQVQDDGSTVKLMQIAPRASIFGLMKHYGTADETELAKLLVYGPHAPNGTTKKGILDLAAQMAPKDSTRVAGFSNLAETITEVIHGIVQQILGSPSSGSSSSSDVPVNSPGSGDLGSRVAPSSGIRPARRRRRISARKPADNWRTGKAGYQGS